MQTGRVFPCPTCRSRLLCWLWNLGIARGGLRVMIAAVTERSQWNLVITGRQEKQDQWQQCRSAHQTAVQWYQYCVLLDAYFNSRN